MKKIIGLPDVASRILQTFSFLNTKVHMCTVFIAPLFTRRKLKNVSDIFGSNADSKMFATWIILQYKGRLEHPINYRVLIIDVALAAAAETEYTAAGILYAIYTNSFLIRYACMVKRVLIEC